MKPIAFMKGRFVAAASQGFYCLPPWSRSHFSNLIGGWILQAAH